MTRGACAVATFTVGAAGGAFAGLAGVGGGAVVVPLLVGPLRFRQHVAHGTSLAAVGLSAVTAVAVYGHRATIDWGMVGLLLPTSLVGAAVGATLVQRVPPAQLRAAFGAFLLLVAIRMLLPGARGVLELEGVPRVSLALSVGLAGGLLSGALGVGGGAVFVPALVLLFGESQHVAQGVSLALIAPTALVGAVTHWRHDSLERAALLPLGAGAALGSVAGALVASSLAAADLQRVFAGVLLGVGGQMLRTGWGAARAPARAREEARE